MGMVPVLTYAVIAGAVSSFNTIAPPGSADYTPEPRNHFRGVFENDAISGRDRNYTHGTRLDYCREMDSGDAWGVSIVQKMYTPEVHTYGRVEGQHPYCGYTAIGGAYMLRGENFGCSTELQVGTTGRASRAGQTQNAVHGWLNMDKWNGWHDQIHSEVTVQLGSRQVWRVPIGAHFSGDWELDSSVQLQENVGTFSISGGCGFYLRFGRNLPPSLTNNNVASTVFALDPLKKPGYRRDRPSYFLVAGCGVDYVARDLTIDGGVFHDFERSCSRTPWVANAQLGLGGAYHGVDYYCGAMMQGKTYRTQDEETLLGVFCLGWHW